MSWGPLLFGHADPETVEAVREAALRGTSFGAPTEAEVELAAEIADAVPSIEKVRLVSSGTEAAMSALRLARGFTKRDRIIKFAGGYHGHADALLASAGSGLATLGIPSTPGVPRRSPPTRSSSRTTTSTPRGRRSCATARGSPRSSSSRSPGTWASSRRRGYLEALRAALRRSGALLVFDEVITGFRVARGGARSASASRPT